MVANFGAMQMVSVLGEMYKLQQQYMWLLIGETFCNTLVIVRMVQFPWIRYMLGASELFKKMQFQF